MVRLIDVTRVIPSEKGKGKEEEYVLAGEPYKIGRDSDCSIVFPSINVSGKHAVVLPYGNGVDFYVGDISTNGMCVLRQGDYLKLENVLQSKAFWKRFSGSEQERGKRVTNIFELHKGGLKGMKKFESFKEKTKRDKRKYFLDNLPEGDYIDELIQERVLFNLENNDIICIGAFNLRFDNSMLERLRARFRR